MVGRLFRSDNANTEKRNLLLFIHPTIIKDAVDGRNVTGDRYNQIRSLQLAFDSDGSFSTLPDNVDEIYDQRMTLPIPKEQRIDNGQKYQTVPVTAITKQDGETVVDLRQIPQRIVTTPVAVNYAQPQTIPQTVQPISVQPQVERTSNTVTETTIRMQ